MKTEEENNVRCDLRILHVTRAQTDVIIVVVSVGLGTMVLCHSPRRRQWHWYCCYSEVKLRFMKQAKARLPEAPARDSPITRQIFRHAVELGN